MAILWARGQFTAQCLENVVTLKGVDYAMTGQCVGKLGFKKKHINIYIYINISIYLQISCTTHHSLTFPFWGTLQTGLYKELGAPRLAPGPRWRTLLLVQNCQTDAVRNVGWYKVENGIEGEFFWRRGNDARLEWPSLYGMQPTASRYWTKVQLRSMHNDATASWPSSVPWIRWKAFAVVFQYTLRVWKD